MAKGRQTLPALREETLTRGFKTDPDAWAGGVLIVGSVLSRWLSYAEHVNFLLSVKEENFKMLFDVWEEVGWWIIVVCGFMWLLGRYSKKEQPHKRAPTWGLLGSCALVSFILGSIIAVSSSATVPTVISSQTISYGTAPNGSFSMADPCDATVEGSLLLSFKKDYKLVLVCASPDPTKDIASDPHIFVSSLFEIIPGTIKIVATASPSGPFKDSRPTGLTINHYAVLIPNKMRWERLTTLSDMMDLGAKILDPKYYQ
jgi:hypothetical protein